MAARKSALTAPTRIASLQDDLGVRFDPSAFYSVKGGVLHARERGAHGLKTPPKSMKLKWARVPGWRKGSGLFYYVEDGVLYARASLFWARRTRKVERGTRGNRAGKTRKEPVHLLVDWNYVACRKGEQKGPISASRDPGEVTCKRCKRARPAQFEGRDESNNVGPRRIVGVRSDPIPAPVRKLTREEARREREREEDQAAERRSEARYTADPVTHHSRDWANRAGVGSVFGRTYVVDMVFRDGTEGVTHVEGITLTGSAGDAQARRRAAAMYPDPNTKVGKAMPRNVWLARESRREKKRGKETEANSRY